MSLDKNKKIPYPNEKEIDTQIQLILEQGLPQKQSLIASIFEMKNQIGWQYVVLNRGEILFNGLVLFIAIYYLLIVSDIASVYSASFYGLIFTGSPLLFLSLSAYSYYQKYSNHTFELEMTLKYTVFQLLAVRMLFFSGVGVLVNVSLILLLSIKVELNVWQVLLLSLSGLFLFAGGLLFAIRKGNLFRRSVFFIGAWVAFNLGLLVYTDEHYEKFLVGLPTFLYGVILFASLLLFTVSLKQLFYRKQEEAFLC